MCNAFVSTFVTHASMLASGIHCSFGDQRCLFHPLCLQVFYPVLKFGLLGFHGNPLCYMEKASFSPNITQWASAHVRWDHCCVSGLHLLPCASVFPAVCSLQMCMWKYLYSTILCTHLFLNKSEPPFSFLLLNCSQGQWMLPACILKTVTNLAFCTSCFSVAIVHRQLHALAHNTWRQEISFV